MAHYIGSSNSTLKDQRVRHLFIFKYLFWPFISFIDKTAEDMI